MSILAPRNSLFADPKVVWLARALKPYWLITLAVIAGCVGWLATGAMFGLIGWFGFIVLLTFVFSVSMLVRAAWLRAVLRRRLSTPGERGLTELTLLSGAERATFTAQGLLILVVILGPILGLAFGLRGFPLAAGVLAVGLVGAVALLGSVLVLDHRPLVAATAFATPPIVIPKDADHSLRQLSHGEAIRHALRVCYSNNAAARQILSLADPSGNVPYWPDISVHGFAGFGRKALARASALCGLWLHMVIAALVSVLLASFVPTGFLPTLPGPVEVFGDIFSEDEDEDEDEEENSGSRDEDEEAAGGEDGSADDGFGDPNDGDSTPDDNGQGAESDDTSADGDGQSEETGTQGEAPSSTPNPGAYEDSADANQESSEPSEYGSSDSSPDETGETPNPPPGPVQSEDAQAETDAPEGDAQASDDAGSEMGEDDPQNGESPGLGSHDANSLEEDQERPQETTTDPENAPQGGGVPEEEARAPDGTAAQDETEGVAMENGNDAGPTDSNAVEAAEDPAAANPSQSNEREAADESADPPGENDPEQSTDTSPQDTEAELGSLPDELPESSGSVPVEAIPSEEGDVQQMLSPRNPFAASQPVQSVIEAEARQTGPLPPISDAPEPTQNLPAWVVDLWE